MNDFPEGMLDEISRFFRDVHPRLIPGNNLYPEIFETGTFFPLQRIGELATMIQEARRVNPKVVMEIGADKGGSLYHWCQCLQPDVVIGCEIRGTPYRQLFQDAFPSIEFIWRERSSYDPSTVQSIKFALEGLGFQYIDVLFIDGDKRAFRQDFDAYRPLMNPAGVVFFHDVKDASLMRGDWLSCKEDGYRVREIVDLSDTHKSLELERLGHPCRNSHDQWLREWRGRSAGVGVVLMPDHPEHSDK